MDTTSAGRPGRRITSCGECYRRKQKCNRRYPCNVCLRRGLPDICHYGSVSRLDPQSVTSTFPTPLTPVDTDPPDARLLQHVGYSDSSSTSTLVTAQQVNGTPAPGIYWTDDATQPGGIVREWMRLVSKLPPQVICEDLVGVFLSEVNWYAQVLEPAFFYDLLSAWGSRNAAQQPRLQVKTFPALLFQVLAMALLFLPPDTSIEQRLGINGVDDRDSLSATWSSLGTKLANLADREWPTLPLVQQSLLRSLWLKTNGRGLAAWHALGTAIRDAQTMGLHLEPTKNPETYESPQDAVFHAWEDQYRRRVWVTLFAWDSHMSVLLGRPRAINRADCTVAPPNNCDIPAERTTSLPMTAGPLQVPPAFSNRLLTYALGCKVHEMLSVGAHTRAVADYDTVLRLHDEIISIWHGTHPALRPRNPDTTWDARHPLVKKQREYAKVHANSTLLTLHREHASVHESSRKAAIEAAHGSLAAQDNLFHMLPPNQHRIYGLSCHSIDAAIFVAYNLLESSKTGSVESIQFGETVSAVQKSIDRLTRMQGGSQMALQGARMLRSVLDAVNQIGTSRDELEAGHTPLVSGVEPGGAGSVPFETTLIDARFHPDDFEGDDARNDLLPTQQLLGDWTASSVTFESCGFNL